MSDLSTDGCTGHRRAAYSNTLSRTRKKNAAKANVQNFLWKECASWREIINSRGHRDRSGKNRIYRTIVKLNVRFRRKRNDSRGRSISKGGCVGKTVSHVTNTPVPLANNASPDQYSYSRSRRGQLKKTKHETHLSLAAKYRAEPFNNDCWASGDVLIGWKHVHVLAIFDAEKHDAAHAL